MSLHPLPRCVKYMMNAVDKQDVNLHSYKLKITEVTKKLSELSILIFFLQSTYSKLNICEIIRIDVSIQTLE